MSGSADGRVVVGVVALCLVQLVDVLGVTVVVSTLPRMLSDVGADASAGALVATGYAMAFGGLLMFGARLGDRLGHRRTILISLVIFAAGAAAGLVAGSLLVLTLARCLQGAAAALAVPSALRLLTGLVATDAARARALAGWSAAGAVAGAAGFVVGGSVASLASWRWIFAGMVLVAVLLAALILSTVPADHGGRSRLSLNLASSALLTAAVMATVVATTVLPEPGRVLPGVALLVLAALLVITLAVLDPRARAPLLPRAVWRRPQLVRGATANFLNTATTSSSATLLTLYLQDGLGHGPLMASATLVPFSVAVVVAAALAPGLLSRLSRERAVAVGLGLIAAGLIVVQLVPDRLPVLGAAMAAAGLGIGCSSVAATSLGTDVAESARATASGMINTAAQLGTALGTAAVLLVANLTTGPARPGGPAPRIGWLSALVAATAGAMAFGALRRRPPEPAG